MKYLDFEKLRGQMLDGTRHENLRMIEALT